MPPCDPRRRAPPNRTISRIPLADPVPGPPMSRRPQPASPAPRKRAVWSSCGWRRRWVGGSICNGWSPTTAAYSGRDRGDGTQPRHWTERFTV